MINPPAGTYTITMPSLGEICMDPMQKVGDGVSVGAGVLEGDSISAVVFGGVGDGVSVGTGVGVFTCDGIDENVRVKRYMSAMQTRAPAPAHINFCRCLRVMCFVSVVATTCSGDPEVISGG